jgi:hypothetical protein
LRIAALAFGVVAGLVASLILALGGLDAAALAGIDPRQLSLIRFGLFIIANFGVLGAGVVLAAPLAGTILFVLGAIAWVGAALVLRHGPDYVMLVPPGLLLVSAVFGVIAFLRRPQRDYDDYEDDEQAIATQRAAMASAGRDEGDEDDQSGVAVGAKFFGEGGTATPMHGAMAQRQSESSMRRGPDEDWQPVRRRTEPPRQQSMFRAVDDEYDEEPGFWRVSRITSSILSFGLYGALVAAAVLIFLNLRTAETHPAAAKIEASAPLSRASSSAPRVAAAPTLSPQPSSAAVAAIAPALVAPSTVLPPSSFEPSTRTVAEASELAPPPSAAPSAAASEPAPSSAPPPSAAASEPPPEDLTLGEPPASGPLMPFAMSPQMAAARTAPATRRPTPAAPAPRADAGL